MSKRICPICGKEYKIGLTLVGDGISGGFFGVRVRCQSCDYKLLLFAPTLFVLIIWIISLFYIIPLLISIPMDGGYRLLLMLIIGFISPIFYIYIYIYLVPSKIINKKILKYAKPKIVEYDS